MFELDVNSIIHYTSIASEIIDGRWLLRKIKEEKRRQEQDKLVVKKRKHSYLYRTSPHPLVQWSIETERWAKACLKSKKMELREAVLKFAILGKALEQAKTCKGFERIRKRLKLKSEFNPAAFEAEVAASYIANGWDVEFIEEGNERSPDLRVVRDNGSIFWAECKCRDSLTERDRNLQSFWTELESSLIRVLGPKKLNFAIFVKALDDPDFTQMPALKDFLLDVIDKGGIGFFDTATAKMEPVMDPTRKFLVAVTKLTGPDEEINTSGFGIQSSENLDRVLIASEMRRDESGETYCRNPIAIAVKNTKPSDKVTGIIHAFKSAVGQLPEEGPGVIWIRVPDNAWSDNIDQSFKQAENLIKAELMGSHNQRVNAVVLITRIFQKLVKGSLTGLRYQPLILTIEHENPLQELGK